MPQRSAQSLTSTCEVRAGTVGKSAKTGPLQKTSLKPTRFYTTSSMDLRFIKAGVCRKVLNTPRHLAPFQEVYQLKPVLRNIREPKTLRVSIPRNVAWIIQEPRRLNHVMQTCRLSRSSHYPLAARHHMALRLLKYENFLQLQAKSTSSPSGHPEKITKATMTDREHSTWRLMGRISVPKYFHKHYYSYKPMNGFP